MLRNYSGLLCSFWRPWNGMIHMRVKVFRHNQSIQMATGCWLVWQPVNVNVTPESTNSNKKKNQESGIFTREIFDDKWWQAWNSLEIRCPWSQTPNLGKNNFCACDVHPHKCTHPPLNARSHMPCSSIFVRTCHRITQPLAPNTNHPN